MKIADADRLIHHFESCVDVKLFTVPEIVTIIDSFSVEIPEGSELIIMPIKKTHEDVMRTLDYLKPLFEKQKPGIDNKLLSEEQIPAICNDCKSKAYKSGFDAGYEAGKKDFDINTKIAAAEAESEGHDND